MAVELLMSSICLNITCDTIFNASSSNGLEEQTYFYDFNDTATSADVKG